MKKYFISTAVFALCTLLFVPKVNAQATKPRLMVVPADDWCQQNGFMREFDNQGITVYVPDYRAVFVNNSDVNNVLAAIGEEFRKENFPLELLEEHLKSIESNAAADAVRTNRKTGAGIAESPEDAVYRAANVDIAIKIWWNIEKRGKEKRVQFRIVGVDAASKKQVASITPSEGNPSDASSVFTLLQEAVQNYMPSFQQSVQQHFNTILADGREISVRLSMWDDAFDNVLPDGLDTEIDDEPLHRIIRKWFADNTVKGRFSVNSRTGTQIEYAQVRINPYDDDNIAQNAEDWVYGLTKLLRKYNIKSKTTGIGTGKVVITLGGN
ncbi:hypothetical protein FACS189413_06750 [Bacteroidia bacterium]|nr:hypothetical protein FACS189413_06750 [Bacteroidia bacterium]